MRPFLFLISLAVSFSPFCKVWSQIKAPYLNLCQPQGIAAGASQDCGGRCEPCHVGRFCTNDSDCLSGICQKFCASLGYPFDYLCPKTCVACKDTDPTNNPYLPGRLELPNHTVVIDTCSSPNVLKQANCDFKGTVTTSEVRCKSWEKCVQKEDGGYCLPSIRPIITNRDRSICRDLSHHIGPSESITFWSFRDGETQVSLCDSNTQARYLVCSTDGRVLTVNIIPCSSGAVCASGVCRGGTNTQPTCFETDRGRDPNHFGVVFGTDAEGHDFREGDGCSLGAESVNEKRCLSDDTHDQINIPCVQGKFCKDGECQEGPLPDGICHDTDGRDNSRAGFVTAIYPGGAHENSADTCTPDGTSVEERVCVDHQYCGPSGHGPCRTIHNWPDRETMPCPHGKVCRLGACMPEEGSPGNGEWHCTDSDGRDVHNKGHVDVTPPSQERFAEEDICRDATHVNEWVCSEEHQAVLVTLPCASGEICSNGACQTGSNNPATTCHCTDRDPNDDPYNFGPTIDNQCREHPDYCNGDQLIQVGCDAQGNIVPVGAPLTCEHGCSNGVCLRP